jgi:hypothetical protein
MTLIISIVLVNIIYFNTSIIKTSNIIDLFAIDIGIIISGLNSWLQLASILALLIILFFISYQRFSTNVLFLCISYLTLVMPFMFTNLFISFALYNIGSIIINYFIIYNSDKRLPVAHATSDFIWYRLSDIIVFISIIFLYNSYSFNTGNMLFFGILLRVIIIPSSNNYLKLGADHNFNYYILGKNIIALGALIFLCKNHAFLNFDNTSTNSFYIFSCCFLLVHAIFSWVKYNKLIYFPNNFSYLVMIIALCLFSFKKYILATSFIMLLIIIFPMLIIFTSQNKFYKKNLDHTPRYEDIVILISNLIQNFARFGAQVAARFASIFYANFLFYRIPQIVIGFFQIPLRLFHTGSLQRSMLFIIILLASYYWLWS